jgi:alpha-N-arabinofuranosidase
LRKERERVYANPVHYAHVLLSDLAGGFPVSLQLSCATYTTSRQFGHIPPLPKVPVIDPMAVLSPEGNLILTIVHRCATSGPIDLTVRLDGFKASEVEAVALIGETWYDRNTRDNPTKIVPRKVPASLKDGNTLNITLQPFSLTKLVLR